MFDDEAANQAVSQLEVTATALATACALIEADVPVTVEDFRGRFRQTFDYESARHVLTLQTLAASLHQTALVVRARQYEATAARLAETYAAQDAALQAGRWATP